MQVYQIPRKTTDFQQPVNEQFLTTAVAENLSVETPTEIRELSAGLFNNTYLVTTLSGVRYVLKIAPKHSDQVFYNERYLMQREQSLAPLLETVSEHIPSYLNFFEIDGRQAFLQTYREGHLWQDKIDSLSDEENNKLWFQLGGFARDIHAIKGQRFGYPEPFRRFVRWSEFIVDNVDGMLADCHRLGLICEETRLYRRLLELLIDHLHGVTEPCLLHGDIWPRNVLFSGVGTEIQITGVIDAERAFWGDPLCDWVLIMYDLPEHFWFGYGENLLRTGDPVSIAIYRGMYFILNLLEARRDGESKEFILERLTKINSQLKSFIS